MDRYWQIMNNWRSRWQELSRARKVGWSAACVFVVGFVGLLWWMAQPEYRVLYTGLSAEDAGAITTKLQAKGVPYRLAAGGTTILVPADRAAQLHIDLSTEGLPGSAKLGKGLDLFDQPMLGATPFNQHVNFIRAQQAELARTIMQIDPIIYTRVHIVRPEPSPFMRDQKPTTASVMLKVRPGASLNRTTIAGIASLVAAGVEGLTRENVRIVDGNGRLLSDHQDPQTGMVGSFMDRRKEVERYLADEAERLLASVLGPGKAIVRVTADLNTKETSGSRKTINADGRTPITEQTTIKKTSSGGAPKTGGVTGFGGQGIKQVGGASGGSGGGSTTNEETQKVDYFLPVETQQWHNKLGAIDRLTIAAFIDTSGVSAEQSVTIADVQEMIKKAVGFRAERDEIQVTSVRMPVVNSESFDREWESHQRFQNILTIVRYSSIALGVLCAMIMALVLIRRHRPVETEKKSDQLDNLAKELDRNPEVLAELMSRWMDQPGQSKRTAA